MEELESEEDDYVEDEDDDDLIPIKNGKRKTPVKKESRKANETKVKVEASGNVHGKEPSGKFKCVPTSHCEPFPELSARLTVAGLPQKRRN